MDGREAGEGFEAFGEVVSVEEGGEMVAELSMVLVVIGAHGGVLEGAIHTFDLAVGPRMVRFGEAVIDMMVSAGVFEGMSAEDLAALKGKADVVGGRSGIAWRGEVSAVVGEDGVDAVRNSGDQLLKELGCSAARRSWDESSKGKL